MGIIAYNQRLGWGDQGGRPGTPVGPILVSGYLLPKDRCPPNIREYLGKAQSRQSTSTIFPSHLIT